MRKRHTLILRRENHKHDGLGAVFLGVLEDEESIRQVLAAYLGTTLGVLDFERLDEATLRASVEAPGFEEESQNLVRLGRSLLEKGRHRGAADMFAEALRLDPLNVDALKAEALLRYVREEHELAEDRWIRASEIRGYDGEILRGLARAALAKERRPSAMRYLEEALRLNPDDAEAGELLEPLQRQIEIRFEES